MAGLSPRARWALGAGLAASALAAGAFFVARAQRARATAVAPSASAPPVEPSSGPERRFARRVPPTPLPPWPFEDPSAGPRVVPFRSAAAVEDERIRALPPEERRAERAKQTLARKGMRAAYPSDCRPASEAGRRLLPHYVSPVIRPLVPQPMELGHALVRATQDRDRLLPGESVLLTVELAIDGKRAPFQVQSELLQPGAEPSARPESLETVPFRDDGAPPDRAAKDGIATARVAVPARLGGYEGNLSVRADISTETEKGEVVFPVVAAGPPPAEFTGSVREVVEDGSLALYVGIRVTRAGRYDFTGRIYDSEHRAMAILIANSNIDTSTREIRLSFCGPLIRDENIPSPWELRDMEGFLFGDAGGRADRVPMKTWVGPHRTRNYPMETFTAAPKENSEPTPAGSAPNP